MKILILYATLTLNTEYVAGKIKEYLENNTENDIDILNVEELDIVEELLNYDFIIFGTSTWSEGHFPPDAEDKMKEIEEMEFSLKGKKIFFFGLGESHYDHFCEAVNIAETIFLNKLNADRVGESFLMDGPIYDLYLPDLFKSITDTL